MADVIYLCRTFPYPNGRFSGIAFIVYGDLVGCRTLKGLVADDRQAHLKCQEEIRRLNEAKENRGQTRAFKPGPGGAA